MIVQILTNGLVTALVYSLIALGFALIYRTTRIFHFAYASTYTVAGYVFYTSFSLFHLPVILAVMITLLSAAAFGVSVDRLVYSPLIRRSSSVLLLLLSSLALDSIIVNLIAIVYGNQTKVLVAGLQPTYSIGNVVLSRIQIAIVCTSIGVLGIVTIILFKTNIGKIIRAACDDSQLLMNFGVSGHAIRLGAFAIGSAICALPAFLVATDVGITPFVGTKAMLKAAVAVIIGGPRIFYGAIAGAFLIGLLEALTVWLLSAKWSDLATFAILFLFLLCRPQGMTLSTARVDFQQ
ncbi:MAG TPA: branched-chain amino acid ABC transporter permease [Anaerolineales bacterium]|nr:branched-chain amino acid ABC transporter permease [Anaerolineales bacterium]